MRLRVSEKAMKELSRNPKVNDKKLAAAAKKKAEEEEKARAKTERDLQQTKLREEKKAALARAKALDDQLQKLIGGAEKTESKRAGIKAQCDRDSDKLADLRKQVEELETRLGEKRAEMANISARLSTNTASLEQKVIDKKGIAKLLDESNEAWLEVQTSIRKKERDRQIKKTAERLVSKQG